MKNRFLLFLVLKISKSYFCTRLNFRSCCFLKSFVGCSYQRIRQLKRLFDFGQKEYGISFGELRQALLIQTIVVPLKKPTFPLAESQQKLYLELFSSVQMHLLLQLNYGDNGTKIILKLTWHIYCIFLTGFLQQNEVSFQYLSKTLSDHQFPFILPSQLRLESLYTFIIITPSK